MFIAILCIHPQNLHVNILIAVIVSQYFNFSTYVVNLCHVIPTSWTFCPEKKEEEEEEKEEEEEEEERKKEAEKSQGHRAN